MVCYFIYTTYYICSQLLLEGNISRSLFWDPECFRAAEARNPVQLLLHSEEIKTDIPNREHNAVLGPWGTVMACDHRHYCSKRLPCWEPCVPALQLCPTCAPLLVLRSSRNTLLTSAPLPGSASSKIDSPPGYTEPDTVPVMLFMECLFVFRCFGWVEDKSPPSFSCAAGWTWVLWFCEWVCGVRTAALPCQLTAQGLFWHLSASSLSFRYHLSFFHLLILTARKVWKYDVEIEDRKNLILLLWASTDIVIFYFPHFCLLQLGEMLKLKLLHKTKKSPTNKDKESNYALSSLVMFAQIISWMSLITLLNVLHKAP